MGDSSLGLTDSDFFLPFAGFEEDFSAFWRLPIAFFPFTRARAAKTPAAGSLDALFSSTGRNLSVAKAVIVFNFFLGDGSLDCGMPVSIGGKSTREPPPVPINCDNISVYPRHQDV
jgi:hypothetical protein